MSEITSFSTSSTAVSASGFTGGTCQKSGPYVCSGTTPVAVFYKSGQRFGTDPTGRSVSWSIVGGSGSSTMASPGQI
jgi:hypothetical protein